jgi:hypothetical protein
MYSGVERDMHEIREPLIDKLQTSNAIKGLVKKYATDLDTIYTETRKPLSSLSLKAFFDFVRKIPYRKDTKPIEIIARPFFILKHRRLGMDCKKKCELLASWFFLHNIPFRLIGSSRRPDKEIHHIFPQARCLPNESLTAPGDWRNYDATYSNYYPDQTKKVTAFEVL